MQVSRVEQLALFVTDKKSAILWLRQELHPETSSGFQTYQEIQLEFHQVFHKEKLKRYIGESFFLAFVVWTLDKKQGGWSLYSTNRQVVE